MRRDKALWNSHRAQLRAGERQVRAHLPAISVVLDDHDDPHENRRPHDGRDHGEQQVIDRARYPGHGQE